MAGKSCALHAVGEDATPFTFTDEQPASAYFGEQLEKAGYNYHGTERMYSGITGEEFDADIFIGVVYYQRLRHMVSDKVYKTLIPPDTTRGLGQHCGGSGFDTKMCCSFKSEQLVRFTTSHTSLSKVGRGRVESASARWSGTHSCHTGLHSCFKTAFCTARIAQPLAVVQRVAVC